MFTFIHFCRSAESHFTLPKRRWNDVEIRVKLKTTEFAFFFSVFSIKIFVKHVKWMRKMWKKFACTISQSLIWLMWLCDEIAGSKNVIVHVNGFSLPFIFHSVQQSHLFQKSLRLNSTKSWNEFISDYIKIASNVYIIYLIPTYTKTKQKTKFIWLEVITKDLIIVLRLSVYLYTTNTSSRYLKTDTNASND